MIIYPPIVPDELVPIVTTATSTSGGIEKITAITMQIPFIDNPAVNISNVKSLAIQLKRYHDSEIILQTYRTFSSADAANGYRNISITGLNSKEENIIRNNAYKIQISYVDTTTPSNYADLAWSTAITGFCFGKAPAVEFQGVSIQSTTLTAKMSNLSVSEPIYEYCFRLYKGSKLVEDSKWHYNTSGTTDTFSYKLLTVMDTTATNYKAVFYYKTVSGYSGSKVLALESNSNYSYVNTIEFSNSTIIPDVGGIKISLYNDAGVDSTKYCILQRKVGSGDWMVMKQLAFSLKETKTFFDYDIEQGTTVQYRTQLCNSSYTTYISPATNSSDVVKISNIDFEHLFLNDANKQLTIKFNPKVSTFKQNIMETKIDTLGGRFPIFSRNGQVKYMEIGISGLISYHMDKEELFMSKEDIGIKNKETCNLSDINIAAERKFRNAVYEWLNNGEYKVFRSPTEGNFIVRLMNISLSPNDQLSRMTYSFSATAYEVMEYNHQNLIDNNLIFGG